MIMMYTKLYIGNLPYGVREKDVDKFFKGFGHISDVLLKDGYGFVEFESSRDADDAQYEMDGKELLGSRVKVEFAKGRDDRGGRDDYRGGGGGYGGGGYGRG